MQNFLKYCWTIASLHHLYTFVDEAKETIKLYNRSFCCYSLFFLFLWQKSASFFIIPCDIKKNGKQIFSQALTEIRRSIFCEYFHIICKRINAWETMEKWGSTELFRYSFQIPSRSVLDCYFRRDNTVSHCGKSVQLRSFFWSALDFTRTKYRNIWTRKNSIFRHFSCSVNCWKNVSSYQSKLCVFRATIMNITFWYLVTF